MANALTKSSQLLALLKHSSSATTAPASMDVTTVSVPKPEESSEESATSRLKAALSLSQRPNVVAPPAAPAVALPVTAVSDSTDKSKMLLSLVRGRAEGSQSRAAATKDSSSSDAVQTPVKPPSRAVEASTGAELLTDGDIAKMMNALIAKPQPATRSPQQPSPVVPSPSASAATSSATLIAPSSLFAEEVSVPPSAMKPIKKSSIKLISPSDLEAF